MAKKKEMLLDSFAELIDKGKKARDTQELTIIEELKVLIPKLTPEEFDLLEKNILEEGIRDPLVIWKNNGEKILIDGHNRHEIAKKHNITFYTTEKSFESIEKVKDWMIANQLGKRNLTEQQKSYLRGLQYHREKKKEINIENLTQFNKKPDSTKPAKFADSETKNTALTLAEAHKVSERTIHNDEKFALGLNKLTENNPELKQEILARKTKVPANVIQQLATEEDKKMFQKIESLLKENKINEIKKVLQNKKQTLSQNTSTQEQKKSKPAKNISFLKKEIHQTIDNLRIELKDWEKIYAYLQEFKKE